jgi:hypothetical protein
MNVDRMRRAHDTMTMEELADTLIAVLLQVKYNNSR